jgi:hypothetical protein
MKTRACDHCGDKVRTETIFTSVMEARPVELSICACGRTRCECGRRDSSGKRETCQACGRRLWLVSGKTP